jgi:hypothetical protein
VPQPFHAAQAGQTAAVKIVQLEPTVFFPRPAAGEPLKQRAILHVTNPGAPVSAVATITVGSNTPYQEDLGTIAAGDSAVPVAILDTSAPCKVSVAVRDKSSSTPLDTRDFNWQPQKKWKIYSVSYSHHDLGYGNYPHRLRTEIRHANIERPLEFCRQTDSWDEDSKFRFMIETAEPITSYLASHSEADAADLARRIREGRIQVGGFHSTVSTEQMSEELLARLFYLGLRHTPDLLGVRPGNTVQIDDVIGLTWPLATYIKEAGVPYLFHGHNGCGDCFRPASLEPAFFWRAPDGDTEHQVLVRSTPYGGYAGDALGDGSEAQITEIVTKFGAGWPYDALLIQEGTDFRLVTMDIASKIHDWNARYAYPHLVCSTMDMFFNAVAAQMKPGDIKSFAGDGNNQWVDQDSTDAWALGIARRQDELVPTAEKFSTIATALAGGGYPWLDVYQAYHRLLTYHEHTDAIDFFGDEPARVQQYETELVEDREMVVESREFTEDALDGSLAKLTRLIKTGAAKNLVVFNPLTWKRTDVVRFAASGMGTGFQISDASTGKVIPHQVMPDGQAVFVAEDVPGVGYKTFSIQPGGAAANAAASSDTVLENRFYRVEFDPATGVITSIQDKELNQELVDSSAPHHFNEYLYEHYQSALVQAPPQWYRVASAQLAATRGPVAALMTVKAAATGVDSLQQTVILYNDIKRIDFSLDLVKSPSGRNATSRGFENKEGVYVALPFSVPDFAVRHELPGAVAEPIRQQFEGTNTAYYSVRHFTDISNARYGVTVSSPDVAMMEYDHPRSCPVLTGHEDLFEMNMQYPASSRLYLYLLDNAFDVNVRIDQRGPLSFHWAMRSHTGNWRQGQADQFGWQVLNPLVARVVDGTHAGKLPAESSFLVIDKPNVVCSTIKPAEANGAGLILRFNETQGEATNATVTLPFLDGITAANETNLVEVDRPTTLSVVNGRSVAVSLRPFGVKTIRVTYRPEKPLSAVSRLAGTGLSDMEVQLTWQAPAAEGSRLSHFNVYRGSSQTFTPSLLNLVASPASGSYVDRPQLNYGGWINHRLEPDTTYYYRIAPVDRWNNQGPLSAPVAVKTLRTSEKNAVPIQVQALRTVRVSDLTPLNYINLIFRTSPESDVRRYEVHRSLQETVPTDASTCIGFADANGTVKGSTVYGHVPFDHRMGEYDHMMYADHTAQPATTYYYRVCAVDTAGQRGPCSAVASARTK